MLSRLFWLFAGLALGVMVHAAFVLLLPSVTLKRNFAWLNQGQDANTFFVLPTRELRQLFPGYPTQSVLGACAFDVSRSSVNFTAQIPPGFWTFTVYASSGQVIYSLNDQQTGTGNFTVNLTRAPSLLEVLTELAPDDLRTSTGWTVSAKDPRGLAVLWQPVAETAQRAEVVKAFEKTICQAQS